MDRRYRIVSEDGSRRLYVRDITLKPGRLPMIERVFWTRGAGRALPIERKPTAYIVANMIRRVFYVRARVEVVS